MAAYLVNQLRGQQIEVHQAVSGKNKGDYVVLMNQPYRNLALSLLSKQNFPKEAKFPPYDDIAWTLGYLYGVDVKAEDSVKYVSADLKLLEVDIKYPGKLTGDGTNYIINYKAQNDVLPSLYWLKTQNPDATISILDTVFSSKEFKDTLSTGSVILKGISSAEAQKLSSQFSLDLQAIKTIPSLKQHHVTLPKVAIYHTWLDTQDEGWARFTFDQRGIPYTSINKDDLKKGDLNNRFDVILIPNVRTSLSDFIHEIDEKFGPMPYTKTAEFPSHGYPDSTADMTGGPGFVGMEELNQFVKSGGVLVTLAQASQIIANAGIANELNSYDASGLFHPGSVVNVKARKPSHPVLYGYPEMFPIFKGNTPLLQVRKYNRDMILLQYGTKQLKDEEIYSGPVMGLPAKKEEVKKEDPKKDPPYVLSGMVRNEQTIIGHGSIFNVPSGKGRVIAFTFDPLHRYLNHHDAPLVWNVLINWNHLGN
jgi:hypothetical protein